MQLKQWKWIRLYICLLAAPVAGATAEELSTVECQQACPLEYPPHEDHYYDEHHDHHHEHYREHRHPPHSHGIHYHVTKSRYTFSTIFDMIADNRSIGSIVKNRFHITTHYDLYDSFGAYQGKGISRFFCLGLFYEWAREIDVYDAQGNRIGVIDGQVVTDAPAKFSFYNSAGQRVAIAYLDHTRKGFSLLDSEDETFVLARLNRNFIDEAMDTWEVNLYHPEKISPQLVRVFAAFACDTQDKFKEDR